MIHGPLGIAPLFRPEDARFLLRFPDEEHALVALERGEVLFRDVVLPLPFLEPHEVDPLRLDEPLQGLHESLTHGRDHHRRRHAHP